MYISNYVLDNELKADSGPFQQNLAEFRNSSPFLQILSEFQDSGRICGGIKSIGGTGM